MSIRMELFGVARLRAGVAETELEAATLGEFMRELCVRFPQLEGEVVRDGMPAAGYLVSLDGRLFLDDPELPLRNGSRLLLVSAQAGG